MNYNKIYQSLITRAKTRTQEIDTYYEEHHIIPRCIGGTDSSINLVKLTAEEHLLAHLLLVKLYPESSGMLIAASLMLTSSPSCIGRASFNKKYGYHRRALANQLKQLIWWNNGVKNIRSPACPGPEWIKGMAGIVWNKGKKLGTSWTDGIDYVVSMVPPGPEWYKESPNLNRSHADKSSTAKGKSGHKGTTWYTDGVKNKRALTSPDVLWYPGFTVISKGSKGMFWWNNGITELLVAGQPDSSWIKGMLPKTTINPTKGSLWWTNGVDNKRATDSPGPDWRNGVTR